MAHILFVNLEGKIGGAERSLLLLAKHLRSEFDISAACPSASPLSEALSDLGINSYNLPSPPKQVRQSSSSIIYKVAGQVLSLWYWLKTTWRLIRIIFKTRPDIIHANSFYAGAPSVIAAVLTRKKLLLHARDLADFRFLTKIFGYFSEKIIAVSNAVRDMLIEKGVKSLYPVRRSGAGRTPDRHQKIQVVYNGIESGRFTSPNKTGNDSFVFAHVGQFVPWKNHIAFLKAASIVGSRLPIARFVLIGDDIFGRNWDYKKNVLDYAKNCSAAERISFLGWQENMNEAWSKIDCLVHTAEREPFGRVIIEAMSHKVPVVAIDSCGPGEIIRDNETGLLVQPEDIEGLSNAMLKIAADTELATRLAHAGYRDATSSFTAERTAALIKEIYDEVLSTCVQNENRLEFSGNG
jgi:glycosyltransferase involved in cell wall biosynthesis